MAGMDQGGDCIRPSRAMIAAAQQASCDVFDHGAATRRTLERSGVRLARSKEALSASRQIIVAFESSSGLLPAILERLGRDR